MKKTDAPTKRRPGQRAGLGKDAVLAAAGELIARHGVDGLSVRAVADRVGVAPNAIYTYFPDRSALVDAVLDWLLADVPVPRAGGDWRRGLVLLMQATRRHLLVHADLLPLYLSRPMRGANARALGDATLALLARAGLAGADADDALRILLIYTFGFAAHEAPRRDDPSRAPGDGTFTLGLRWILDGIAAQARGRRG